MISSNLSPGGSSVRNLRDGKFVSGKNIDAATLKAIKNKDVLTVKYLTDIYDFVFSAFSTPSVVYSFIHTFFVKY